MWNLVILTVMTSFAGFYSLQHEKYLPDEKVVIARNLAESMANYKEAVVSYSSAHEDVSGQIANSEISNHYPTGYSNDKAKTWTNYIDEDGTIYVYPAEQLPTKITNESQTYHQQITNQSPTNHKDITKTTPTNYRNNTAESQTNHQHIIEQPAQNTNAHKRIISKSPSNQQRRQLLKRTQTNRDEKRNGKRQS